MTISEIKPMLTACQMAGDTLLVEGVHGIGKSQVAEQWAEENNVHLEVLFLSNQEVGDLIGMPRTVERDNEYITTWTKPIWLQRLEQASKAGKHTAVFLDELNRAPLDVRQSALQLVLEKKIHQHTLPLTNGMKTMMIAATNPSELYQVEELDHALLSRFLYVEVEPDLESFLAYGRQKGINQMVLDFLMENPTRLHVMPAESSKEKVSADPRSWEMLGKLINTFEHVPEALHYSIIKGKVGASIGFQFYEFMRNYAKVVKVEDVISVSRAAWTKTKDINKTAEFLNELIEPMEQIQKTEMLSILSDSMLKAYTTQENAIPLLAMLYAVEGELLGAYLKSQKAGDEEKNRQYWKLMDIDFNKELARKSARHLKI